MVDEPVALRRKYRAEDGLIAVIHSGSQCKISPSKNQVGVPFAGCHEKGGEK